MNAARLEPWGLWTINPLRWMKGPGGHADLAPLALSENTASDDVFVC
jgi:hypothetical protein